MTATMRGFLEPLKIKAYKVRALTDRFFLNGHIAAVGEEGEMDCSDATIAAAAGRVEILGDAPERIIAVKDLRDPPLLRRVV
jgi:hypothetical protein